MNNTLQDKLLTDIATIEKDGQLYEEKNFCLRQQAIDHIEFHVIDRIDALMESTDAPEVVAAKQYAEKVKRLLEEVNTRLFHRLRSEISHGGHRGRLMMELLDEYLDHNVSALQQDTTGYDDLDVFLNGLLTDHPIPGETKDREPEMVYYQKTPARVILKLIKKAEFKPDDVFFDLGSGLGQVTILVNLLASVISKGVEFEPAFCEYATGCSATLHLTDVSFINTDARYADYTPGTVFFMYTPFRGKMLQDVLRNLEREAKKRTIKIFTYGPCTPEVAGQNWLIEGGEMQDRADGFGEFQSRR